MPILTKTCSLFIGLLYKNYFKRQHYFYMLFQYTMNITTRFCQNRKHIYEFISAINQLDAQNVCFMISFFLASRCFEHMCSKHLEARNKLIVKQKFCALSWLITEISILRCTVSKTSQYIWISITEISVYFLKGSVLYNSTSLCLYLMMALWKSRNM